MNLFVLCSVLFVILPLVALYQIVRIRPRGKPASRRMPAIPGARAAAFILLFGGLPLLPLVLDGCKATPTVIGQDTSKVLAKGADILTLISALPSSFKADVSSVIAKFPSATADLETVANGVESLATDASSVPLPPTLQNTVVGLAELVPGKIGAVASGIATAYQVAYPELKLIPNMLTAVGEFIRTFEPAQPASTITTALNSRLRAAGQVAYAVLRRHD